ncbi:MAG: two-component system response regulator [Bacteroidetes bacterium QS_9_68_14]|nr:MAG: two-component system response regulator [Bacteroidetes bacterium QS_9_68_14]
MPSRDRPGARLVLADDDPDDRLFMRRALEENGIADELCTVEDGEELLELLRREGRYAGHEGALPGLILLDLNMPRMGGRAVLREMKSDPDLRRIPVVVLTASEAEQDVIDSYDLGAGAFVTKPVRFDELVETLRRVGDFWLEAACLPQ